MHELMTQAEVARWLNVTQEWVAANLEPCAALQVGPGDLRWTKPEITAFLRNRSKRAAA